MQTNLSRFAQSLREGTKTPELAADAIFGRLEQDIAPQREKAAGDLYNFINAETSIVARNIAAVKKLLPRAIHKLRLGATDESQYWLLCALAHCAKFPELRRTEAAQFWQEWPSALSKAQERCAKAWPHLSQPAYKQRACEPVAPK